MRHRSHYDYLSENLIDFLTKMGVKNPDWYTGMVVAHGDKCYSYRDAFEKAGMRFEQGVMIYLLTYIRPWADECRETPNGWVPPDQWIINNKDRFLGLLP